MLLTKRQRASRWACGSEEHMAWVRVAAALFTSYVSVGRLLNHSVSAGFLTCAMEVIMGPTSEGCCEHYESFNICKVLRMVPGTESVLNTFYVLLLLFLAGARLLFSDIQEVQTLLET